MSTLRQDADTPQSRPGDSHSTPENLHRHHTPLEAGKKKRQKAKRVCVRCKMCKTVCDDERPCRRCIRLGYEAECVDAEPKVPRSRPSKFTVPAMLARQEDTRSTSSAGPAHSLQLSAFSSPSHGQSESEAFFPDRTREPSPFVGVPSTRPFASLLSAEAFASSELPTNIDSPGSESDADAGYPQQPALGGWEEGLLEGFLDTLKGASQSMTSQIVLGAKLAMADGGKLQTQYCNHAYAELCKWHDRIASGVATNTAPMYILYCRHYLNMAASFKTTSEETLNKQKDLLLSNLPEDPRIVEYMTDRVSVPTTKELIGDKVTELVYHKMPLAIIKIRNHNFLLQPTFLNEQAVAMLGWSEEEAVHLTDQMFIMRTMHPDCWTNLALAICTAVVNHQDVFQIKSVSLHKDGTMFDVICTIQLDWARGPLPTGGTIYLQKI